ncbi:EAL domain-containing protein [Leptolyngbya iicbica]|nr:EAL domain-containing protein [Leptolyngbya sp. LK]
MLPPTKYLLFFPEFLMAHSSRANSPPQLENNFLAINPEALTLLQMISMEVSKAADFESALTCLLELVCSHTAWVYGEVWLPSGPQVLKHSGVWFASHPQYHAFSQGSQTWTFEAGQGLPGRVYHSGQTEWIADVAEASSSLFKRRDLAAEYGLGAAVGVPVSLDDDTLMVLVFLMNEAHACDRLQIHLVEAVAAHLGAILRLKRTEAELLTHQQYLQRLMNTLPGIVFTAKGPPDWKMRSLSDGCLRLTGYSHADLTTETDPISYNDITHPDDLPGVLAAIQQALSAAQFYEVEYRIITRSGETKWVWEKGQGVLDQQGNPIGLEGFITDISTLKQAETALRESETRYRMLAERSLDLISQHDLHGNIQYMSSGCQNLLGYAAAELVGKSPMWLVHPQDHRHVVHYFRQFLSRQTTHPLRFRMRHRDGSYRWFETISCMMEQSILTDEAQVLAVTRDVTQTVEAETTLVDREKFLNLVLDSIPQRLFWKDHNGVYRGCNQTFAESIGLPTTAAVVGKTDYDIAAYSPEAARQFRQQDHQIMQNNWPEINVLEQHGQGAEQTWINVSKFPIHNAEQQVVGVLGSLEDVSDRIEFQQSLNRREQYLTALVELQRQLLDLDDTWNHERFEATLEPLATATGASRALLYVVDAHDPSRLLQTAQWTDAETPSTFGDPQVAVLARDGALADWTAALAQGECINQTVDEFPPAIRPIWGAPPSNVKSILLLPLLIRGHFNGLVGFSNCQVARQWSPSEVTLLRVAANAIAIAMERLQAEQSRQQAESKYRSIFENAVEGIFQTTTEGRYITVNPMLAKIYGYDSPDDLITSLTNIATELYVDVHQRHTFVERMLRDGAVIGYESAVYRKDGSIIWISESARTIFDAQGQIMGFEGTVEDITQRKQAEIELHQRDRLLEGVAQASQQLLTNLNVEDSIHKMLATLGEAAAADRVYIYENHLHPISGEPCMSMRYEWTQAHITPSIHQSHWQNKCYSEHGLIRWYRALQAGQSIRGRVSTLPLQEQDLLSRDAIASILMVPIFIDQDLWGYIGFDACDPDRDWTPSEESILVTIAASVGGALKRQHTEAQMRYQAFHDPLTGLPNRTAFNQELPLIITAARRRDQRVAVMFLDLDRFKNINDTLGHAIGDQLLVQATQRLSDGLRREDLLARWGGDEFTLILQNIDSLDEASRVAERLSQKLKPPFLIENHELYVTSSIGIAVFPQDGDSVTTLLQNADAAMYAAKAAGRNTHRFYTSTLSSHASQQLLLEKHLHQALQREEFRLYFQPQIDVAQGRICRIEALLRWRSPELGEVMPNQFIPIAEEIGLIIPLGDWVLKQACCQLQIWQEQGFSDLEIAVNLSARQLHHATLVQDVEQVLAAFDLAPQSLELEVTETAALSNLDVSIATLQQLRQLGIRLVMDDFGTGYSSLSYLKRLPFHGLKIDRSFVENIPNDAQDMAMLKAVVALGQALQLGLVAEGVETPEQATYLRSLGCEQMQGYWFSRPLSRQAMTAFLQRHWPHYNTDNTTGVTKQES